MSKSNFIIATSAPDAYDYGHTTEIVPFGAAKVFGKDVRIVKVDLDERGTYLGDYQADRYLSGMHVSQRTQVDDLDLATLIVTAATGGTV